jgi:hypothetical protein
MSLLTISSILKAFGFLGMICLSAAISADEEVLESTDSFQTQMNQSPDMDRLLGPLEDKTSALWLSSQRFESHLEASTAASNRFNPRSILEDREYVGVILKHEGVDPYYLYTVSRSETHADIVPFRIVVPQGYELAAFWHTHGAEHWSRVYFSSQDTSLSKRWNVPIYLATHKGALQVFNPESATRSSRWAKQRGFGNINGIAKGQWMKDNRIATVL